MRKTMLKFAILVSFQIYEDLMHIQHEMSSILEEINTGGGCTNWHRQYSFAVGGGSGSGRKRER